MQPTRATPHKDRVASRFNATAGAYDANRTIKVCAKRMMELVELHPGERVLDVACGTGNLALLAAQAVGATGRVVGVDLTEGMLAQAQHKAQELRLPNVEFRVGDAEQLDIGSEEVDVVLCGLGIMFIPDRLAAAKEWNRVLRPGGRVALSTWRHGFGTPALRQLLNARLATMGLNAASISDQTTQDPEACRNLLEDAGFVDVVVMTEQHGFFYSTPTEYWDEDVAGSITGALLAPMEPAQLERLKDEHLAEVAATATTEGIWREGAVNFARAWKPS